MATIEQDEKATKPKKAKLKFDTATELRRVEERYVIRFEDDTGRKLEVETHSLGNPVNPVLVYEDGTTFTITKKDAPRVQKAAWAAIWAAKNARKSA